jgi:dTDP-4-amino-4,6-dideoxygalactose transaminase
MSELALFGGLKTKSKPFPPWPEYDEQEIHVLQEVLQSRNWWRTPGTKTLEFEQAFAAYHEAKHGIAVTNGTHALEVVLSALNVGPGDEVIIPDFTFVATASAVLFAGALPVMVDVQPDTYCVDPDAIEGAITPRTKAIIAVHMGGHPANIDRLTEIATSNGLPLVEDSAHAHGSEWRDHKVGTAGIAATFSFQASKLMTAGEGGIIITNDGAFERLARSTHDCGRMPEAWFYSHFVYGSNYRLSEWQGAILGVQLTRLDKQTTRRHKNARLLDILLGDIEGITPQHLDERCTRNGHYAYIFHYNKAHFGGASTKRFIEALNAEGIPTQDSYPPVHALDLFQSGTYRRRLCPEQAAQDHAFLRQSFPNSSIGAWETVWIPQYALLGDEEDMHQIAFAIKKLQQSASELK